MDIIIQGVLFIVLSAIVGIGMEYIVNTDK